MRVKRVSRAALKSLGKKCPLQCFGLRNIKLQHAHDKYRKDNNAKCLVYSCLSKNMFLLTIGIFQLSFLKVRF